MRNLLMAAALCSGIAGAQDLPFTVQLTTPLSTQSNHAGDPVSGKVLQPAAFSGDVVQGHVTESKSGNKLHGQASLRFNFDTIQHGGAPVPIASSITSIANSRGQTNVDEEGTVVNKTSNVGKAVLGTGAGALIGGLTGGGKGAAIGAGVGAAASIVAIEVAAKGPKVEFAPGSTIGLSVKSRGGPDLATLPPNSPSSSPAASTPTAYVPGAPVAPGVPAAPGASASNAAMPASAAPAAAGGQPQLSSIKIDFVPGEKTVFFDDFSDMAQDEPPPHWKLRENPVELRIGGGIHELYADKNTQLTSPAFKVPANFTFELEFTGRGEMGWVLQGKNDSGVLDVMVRGEDNGQDVNASVQWDGHGPLGQGGIQADNSKPIHFALWVQQGRVRAYINGTRIVDVNQVTPDPIDHLYAEIGRYRPVGLRSVRLAESAPDFSTMIGSTGRYITHGIMFDTDSDRLKPESAPVLKLVAQGLQKNPNLKLEIDGYTDSTGDAQHNQALSQKRAEAVRTVLVSQFGIEAARLTSGGFGAANPIGSNDSPDGRAQNRRVEFVKQ